MYSLALTEPHKKMKKTGEIGTGVMVQLVKSLSYEPWNPTLVFPLPHLKKNQKNK